MSGLLSIGSRAASVRRQRRHLASTSAHTSPTHSHRSSLTHLSPGEFTRPSAHSAPVSPAHTPVSPKSPPSQKRPTNLNLLAPPSEAPQQGAKSAPVTPHDRSRSRSGSTKAQRSSGGSPTFARPRGGSSVFVVQSENESPTLIKASRSRSGSPPFVSVQTGSPTFVRSDDGSPVFARSHTESPTFIRSRSGSRTFVKSQTGSPTYVRSRSGSPTFIRSQTGSPTFVKSRSGSPTFIRSQTGSPTYVRSRSGSPTFSRSRSGSFRRSRSTSRSRTPIISKSCTPSPSEAQDGSFSPSPPYHRSPRASITSFTRSSPSPSPSFRESPTRHPFYLRGTRATSWSFRGSSATTPLSPAPPSTSTSYSTFDSLPWGLSHYHHQVSVDDRRQLFSAGKLNVESGMSAYGSIVYQMKDANMEANSTCEFVYKALKIFSKTVLMTVLLIITIAVPVLMVIIGVQYLHECPLEPNIPIYLLVGGCFGTMKMLWLVCQQIRSRRYERIDDAFAEDSLDEIFTSTSYRATDVALTIFLIVWFGMGNYWVYRIYPPNFLFTLFAPNDWCSKTLYLFAVAQLLFVYAVLGCLLVLVFFLACGQKCVMVFGESYK